MLRTNSTEARNRLMSYVMEWTADEISDANEWNARTGDPKRYDANDPASVAAFILDRFNDEYSHEIKRYGAPTAFEAWASGLALGGLFCYYYNRSAVDDVQKILKETDEEAQDYTEAEAERFLTGYIYKEMRRRASR
jgi:hypothetical protein